MEGPGIHTSSGVAGVPKREEGHRDRAKTGAGRGGGDSTVKKVRGVNMSYKKSSKFVGVLQEWTGGQAHWLPPQRAPHEGGDVEGCTLDTTSCAGIKPQGPHVGDHPRTRWARGGW